MRVPRRLLTPLLLLLLVPTLHAAVMDYDGRWSVRAMCGVNASNGRPGFTERAEWTIAQGRIRETRAQTTPYGGETTTWEGQIDGGRITVDATGRRDNGDVWTWQLTGAAQGNDRMTLAGGLYAQTKKVRDCTMELTALTPAVNSLLGKANSAVTASATVEKPQSDPVAKAPVGQPVEKPGEAPRAAHADKRSTATGPAAPAKPVSANPAPPVAQAPTATVAPAVEPPLTAPIAEPAPVSAPESTSTEAATSDVTSTSSSVVVAAPTNDDRREVPWTAIAVSALAIVIVVVMAWMIRRRRRHVATDASETPISTQPTRDMSVVTGINEPVTRAETAPAAEAAEPASPPPDRSAEDCPVTEFPPTTRALETPADVRIEPAPSPAPAAASEPAPAVAGKTERALKPAPAAAPEPAPASPPASESEVQWKEPPPEPGPGRPDAIKPAWHKTIAILSVYALALLAADISPVATLQSLLAIGLCISAYRPAWLPAAVGEPLSRHRMKAILAIVAIALYYALRRIYLLVFKVGGASIAWIFVAVSIAVGLTVYLLHKHRDAE